MNITEASSKATVKGYAMYRKGWKFNYFSFVKPTDTEECCIILEWNIKTNEIKKTAVRWNPRLSDLIANDWEVIDVVKTMKTGVNKVKN